MQWFLSQPYSAFFSTSVAGDVVTILTNHQRHPLPNKRMKLL